MPRMRADRSEPTVQALQERLTLGRYWQNPVWLQRQVSKGRVSQLQVNILRDMIVVLEQLYPNNWDFSVKVRFKHEENTVINQYGGGWYTKRVYKWTLEFFPVIKIGDGTITNTAGEEHEIKQLYFRIHCPTKKVRGDLFTPLPNATTLDFNKLHGTRTVLSLREAASGYFHSHMSANPLRGASRAFSGHLEFHGVCIGHGDTLAQQLLGSLSDRWDIETFRAFVVHLETIAFWESVEGMPHMYMSQAEGMANASENEDDIAPHPRDYHIDEMASKIERVNKDRVTLRGEAPIQLNWTVDAEGKFTIIDDEKLEEYLRFKGNNINDYHSLDQNWLVTRAADGTQYKAKDRLPVTRAAFDADTMERVHYLVFRGEKVYLRLIGEDEPDRGPVTFYLHSSIKEHVKRKLEQRAAKQNIAEVTAAREDAAHWLSRISNARRGIESNQVPVQGNQ